MKGYFGRFGGQFVAETLMSALEELEKEYTTAAGDESFQAELDDLLCTFAGRPTPLTYMPRLSEQLGGAQIYLKREDLAYTGAHKINNALGQSLLAKRMGKRQIVAETGAGQHGVAVATACSRFGLDCVIYMGAIDAKRQHMNVQRMQFLGADVRFVETGTRTLKDAITEAIRYWITNVTTSHYLLGSVVGPHPFPTIVRNLQSVIGKECRAQMLVAVGRLPDCVVACVGGGSNSIGIFSAFLEENAVRQVGVEAAGDGIESGRHAAPLLAGSIGVLHGSATHLLQDEDGQILETYSIAPGLDYPAVGPEHSHLKEIGRVQYTGVSNEEALRAFQLFCRCEGILPALESAHALAKAVELAPQMKPDQTLVVNLSGRGDKDLDTVARTMMAMEAER